MAIGLILVTIKRIQDFLHPEREMNYQVELKIYRNYPLKTDLNIQIRWESYINRAGESSIGRRLHHIMKDYGLICHMVWIEEAFD